MTTQQVSTTARPPRHTRKLPAGAALGAALALVVAAGIGAWQLTNRGTDTDTAAVTSPPARASADAGRRDTMGGLAEQMRDRRQSAPATASPVTPVAAAGATGRHALIYLVGSWEQAASIQDELDGRAPGDAEVVVVTSSEEAGRMMQAAVGLNAIRDAEGLAPIQVVDLRATPAPVRSVGSGASGQNGPLDASYLTP